MIQALYQALQISVSWERVSEIQSIKESAKGQQSEIMARLLNHPIIKCTGDLAVFLPTHAAAASSTCPFDAAEVCVLQIGWALHCRLGGLKSSKLTVIAQYHLDQLRSTSLPVATQ